MIDISELTEWVIITMLITGAGMFVLSVGYILTWLYYIYKSKWVNLKVKINKVP